MFKDKIKKNPSQDVFYSLGVLGALFYYISVAEGFWAILLAILKAFVWPAFMVFELLKFLEMWKGF